MHMAWTCARTMGVAASSVCWRGILRPLIYGRRSRQLSSARLQSVCGWQGCAFLKCSVVTPSNGKYRKLTCTKLVCAAQRLWSWTPIEASDCWHGPQVGRLIFFGIIYLSYKRQAFPWTSTLQPILKQIWAIKQSLLQLYYSIHSLILPQGITHHIFWSPEGHSI